MWLDLIGIALFTNWLLHWFTPLQPLREKIVEKIVRVMVRHNLWFIESFITVFTCPYCLAFWVSLIYTQHLTYALITSFMALVIRMTIKKHNEII